MLNSSKMWLGCLAGIAALSLGGVAHATPFPPAPIGAPAAGAIGLGLLAAGAVALGIRQAMRNK